MKELAQQGGALFGGDPGIDFWPMVALGMVKNPRAMEHAARFGIVRAPIEPPDAAGGDHRGAHGAWLQRHIERTAGQALCAEDRAGRAQRQHLGMGRGILHLACAIARAGQHHPRFGDDDRAHGNLAARGGFFGLGEGDIHEAAKTHASPCRAMRDFAIVQPRVRGGMTQKTPSSPPGDRIAKVIARAGRASRREAERLIEAGRVTVNGEVITRAALNVTEADKITVDGIPLSAPEPERLWLYHKPTGLVTTHKDEQGRPTIYDDLPEDMPRVMSVGRLDLNSEGLLLLTNDGAVKRKLELPSTGWLRKYRVRVKGRPDEAALEPLREGITVDRETFQPMVVSIDRQQGANAWLTVALREGRNREIRRAMEAVGLSVNRLIRISYGPFQLGQLKPGAVEEVRRKIVRDQLGLDQPKDAPAKRKPVRRRR